MSKIKVGDITIENGHVSFSQQSTTTTGIQPTSQKTSPPRKESSLKETMLALPGPSILWFLAAIASPVLGAALWMFMSPLVVIFATPLVFFGLFCFGVAFVKQSKKVLVEEKHDQQEQKSQEKHKEILLATLQQKDMQWTFEALKKNLSIPAEELIFALKSCIQEQCVEEELDTDSGEWFYVWQAPQKITERPKSLDERLQEINNNY